MAYPHIHFSCLLDAGSPANAARALDVYVALSEDDTHALTMREAFRLSIEPDHGPSQLWLRDESGGDPQTVIRFVLHCARLFGLSGLWGFCYARLAESHEPDAIGGGTYLLDLGKARILASIDVLPWIDERMEADHG